MNKWQMINKSRGISMVEGMIALVVLSVGLLALFSFQSSLLSSGSEAKARSEAIQIANGKLGELRTQASLTYDNQADFVADANNVYSGNQSVAGTNAAFSVNWSDVDLTGPIRKTITVAVTWTDKDGTQTMNLSSDVHWKNPDLGVALLAKTLPGGGTVASPQGGAEYGDDVADYTPGSPPGDANVDDRDGSEDGTYLYNNAGVWELIDSSSGKILLTSSQAFATIKGRIYLDASDFSESDLQSVWAGAPDISVCTTTRHSPAGKTYDDSSNLVYYYVNYTCYMGAGWFGNIGVVGDDGAGGSPIGNNDYACVGDPNATDSGHADSRHPQINITRTYRGYEELTDDSGQPTTDADGNRLYLSQGIGAGTTYAGDDFLLTTITGTATDADCNSQLQLNGTDEFVNNVGEFVCLSFSGCPSSLPEDVGAPVNSVSTLTISGGISPIGQVSAVITSDGDACTVTGSSYSCQVYDLGTGWSGSVEATAVTGYVITSANPMYFTDLASNSTGNDITLETSGTERTLTISGSIDNVAGAATISGFSLDDGGSCTFDATSYSCTTAPFTDSWTGSMTINQNKTLCADGVTDGAAGVMDPSTSSMHVSACTSSNLIRHISVAQNSSKCPDDGAGHGGGHGMGGH